jgi:hypothetical protein
MEPPQSLGRGPRQLHAGSDLLLSPDPSTETRSAARLEDRSAPVRSAAPRSAPARQRRALPLNWPFRRDLEAKPARAIEHTRSGSAVA